MYQTSRVEYLKNKKLSCFTYFLKLKAIFSKSIHSFKFWIFEFFIKPIK